MLEQRECESSDATQPLLDWALRVFAMVTALLSSTPAVAEGPATPLTTGAEKSSPDHVLQVSDSHL